MRNQQEQVAHRKIRSFNDYLLAQDELNQAQPQRVNVKVRKGFGFRVAFPLALSWLAFQANWSLLGYVWLIYAVGTILGAIVPSRLSLRSFKWSRVVLLLAFGVSALRLGWSVHQGFDGLFSELLACALGFMGCLLLWQVPHALRNVARIEGRRNSLRREKKQVSVGDIDLGRRDTLMTAMLERPLKVFVSYRRSDTAAEANALHEFARKAGPGLYTHREADYGATVLVDATSIGHGAAFERHLRSQVSSCDVLLVLIGPDWKALQSPARKPDATDYVFIEIKLALEHGKSILPVLVRGAPMSKLTEFPSELQPVAAFNAIEMSGTHQARSILDSALTAAIEHQVELRIAEFCQLMRHIKTKGQRLGQAESEQRLLRLGIEIERRYREKQLEHGQFDLILGAMDYADRAEMKYDDVEQLLTRHLVLVETMRRNK